MVVGRPVRANCMASAVPHDPAPKNGDAVQPTRPARLLEAMVRIGRYWRLLTLGPLLVSVSGYLRRGPAVALLAFTHGLGVKRVEIDRLEQQLGEAAP